MSWALDYLVKSARRVTFHTPQWLAANKPKNPGASVWSMYHKPISLKGKKRPPIPQNQKRQIKEDE